MIGTFNGGECPDRDKRLSMFNLQHVRKPQGGCPIPRVSTDAELISEKETKQLCKEKGDSCDRRTKQQYSSAMSESNVPASSPNHQGISKISLKVNRILAVDVKAYCDVLML